MANVQKETILRYELFGMLFIILLGSVLHFTFEWSGYNPIVGAFSAVNESVWEHLKLGFWPALLYLIIEYRQIRKDVNNFFLAKTVVAYAITAIIPAIFYSYTLFTGESIFVIDILSFIVAVIIGQCMSYRLLIHKQLSPNLEKIAIAALLLLAAAFIVFTFIPPHLPPFQDPISGEYGITEHMH
ncbi:MAG: DUF6512 family protein [Candidatus Bathyarchaeota archaeon]